MSEAGGSKIFNEIFLKKQQNLNGRVLNVFTFCEHDIDFYENLSSGFFKRYSKC